MFILNWHPWHVGGWEAVSQTRPVSNTDHRVHRGRMEGEGVIFFSHFSHTLTMLKPDVLINLQPIPNITMKLQFILSHTQLSL